MITAIDESIIKYWEELSAVACALASNLKKLMRHKGKVCGNVVDGGRLWNTEYTITVSPELSARDDWARLEPIDPYLAQNLLINVAAEFPEFANIKDWRELTKENITTNIMERLQLVAHRRTFKGTCEISQSWKSGSADTTIADALNTFLSLYKPGSTHDFYKCYLTKSIPPLELTSTTADLQSFIYSRPCTAGGQHAYYRAIRCFLNWVYSPASGLGFKPSDNPINWVKPPKVDKKIMPAQTEDSVNILLKEAKYIRDQAIIALLFESGGRRSEVASINEQNIDWSKHTIKVIAKGGQEVLMPFGPLTEHLLRAWLIEYHPNGGCIWNINVNGIVSMLRRLERDTGIKCNAHTFRRGFASFQAKNNIDSLHIMRLGHWKSIQMVHRYTESVTFADSLQHYQALLGGYGSTDGLSEKADGLSKKEEVPRPRIELGTRGFSVRCSTD